MVKVEELSLSSCHGSGVKIVTAVARAAADSISGPAPCSGLEDPELPVAWIQSLARELPYAQLWP